LTCLADGPGHLDLTWDQKTRSIFTDGAFEVKAKPVYAKTATVKTSRFHNEIQHTHAAEVFDGLEITVDVPAVRAHVKLRRDAKAAWTELDVPVRYRSRADPPRRQHDRRRQLDARVYRKDPQVIRHIRS
jgi:hypothetical protein